MPIPILSSHQPEEGRFPDFEAAESGQPGLEWQRHQGHHRLRRRRGKQARLTQGAEVVFQSGLGHLLPVEPGCGPKHIVNQHEKQMPLNSSLRLW